MKASGQPIKTVDVAGDLAKENAKLSKDVIRMAIDLEDQKRVETKASRVKWNTGKPGKLSGFKSSKDLQQRSSIQAKEISFNGSVFGDNLVLNANSQELDALQTVEETNYENYKALPMKERISRMKHTLQNRESLPVKDSESEVNVNAMSKTADIPPKRMSLNKGADLKLQKLKKEFKSLKEEEKKTVVDYEKEEQKMQTASVVNLNVPEPVKPLSEVAPPVVTRSRKSIAHSSNVYKVHRNTLGNLDEANSCVMLPTQPVTSANVSNLEYLKKRKKRQAANSPVKQVPREDGSSLIISSNNKPENAQSSLKPLPVKENPKYHYDAALGDWLAELNLKDLERAKELFFSHNISLYKMHILTNKDLTRIGFKQTDPDFLRILRGLIELKEDSQKHPEKYKPPSQRPTTKDASTSKLASKNAAVNPIRRLSSELVSEVVNNNNSDSNRDSNEGMLPRISNPQAVSSESCEFKIPESSGSTSQHLPLERVGSGSLVNHGFEMHSWQRKEENTMDELQLHENSMQSEISAVEASENLENIAEIEGADDESYLNQDVDADENNTARKTSNGNNSYFFNKDPAKLSKILSADLAHKDAKTALEVASKKWEKRQRDQEEEMERAERLERQKKQERDRLAARHRRKVQHTQQQQNITSQSNMVGQTTLNNADGHIAIDQNHSSPERPLNEGETEFELVGAKIKPLATTRGHNFASPFKPHPHQLHNALPASNNKLTSAPDTQSNVVYNSKSKKTSSDFNAAETVADRALVLEGKAVVNSPRTEIGKTQTHRTTHRAEDDNFVTSNQVKTSDTEFSVIKQDLEDALSQLEGTPRLQDLAVDSQRGRKSALAVERENFKQQSVIEEKSEGENASSASRGSALAISQSNSPTMPSQSSPSFEEKEVSAGGSEHSVNNSNVSSTNSTHDLLQQLDHKLQVLKHSGSTPETLSMIDRIKSQLAQFEFGIPGNSTRLLSEYPTFAKRRRPRTVSSAKVANHKDSPVREVSATNELKAGHPPAKAKTLMTLKTSIAEQDMVKNLQKQQTQYKQQIRQLERELKRLKETDPLQNCELNIEDLQFSEENFLGDGAFADVFLGYYSGIEVAVKRLKGLLSSTDESYFNAEVALLKELRHPNVVLLLGVCRDSEGRPLMILEYMASGSLFDVLHDLDRPGLDHVAFYQISKDMAIGMNYLHKSKPGPILHLDLKSMNVLLDMYGRAKIGDFGFSKLKSNTDSGTEKQLSVESRKGSPAWMAPETLQQGKVSTKSDVYSFGIILWEMLTREKPYEGLGLYQVLEGVTKGLRPLIPGWVPDELQNLINICWHAQPNQRPSFQDILDILDHLHLPEEWKSLLDAAGVPRIALEDPEVTRSIVEFIHLSLNVSDSSSSVPTSGGLSESILREERQMIDMEVVSAFEKLTRKQKECSYQSLVPTLSNLSGSSVAMSQAASLIADPPKDTTQIEDDDVTFENPDSSTPRAFSQMMSVEAEKNVIGGETLYTHASRPRTVIGHSGEPIKTMISDAVLQDQRARLRPTTVAPHPSKLANLSSVDEGKLNTIAAVIKQALNERREYMLDDENSERSTLFGDDRDSNRSELDF